MTTAQLSKKYLRKSRVASRYDATERSVDRWARSGRLPAPVYPLGPHLPLWRVEDLDAHDARTTEIAAA